MTVADLIRQLSAYPPETRVVTRGFDEYRHADVGTVKSIKLHLMNADDCEHLEPDDEFWTEIGGGSYDWYPASVLGIPLTDCVFIDR